MHRIEFGKIVAPWRGCWQGPGHVRSRPQASMLSARGLRPAFRNAAVQWNASRHTVLGKNRQDVYVMHSVTVSVSVSGSVSKCSDRFVFAFVLIRQKKSAESLTLDVTPMLITKLSPVANYRHRPRMVWPA